MTQQQQTETQTNAMVAVGDIKVAIGNVELVFRPTPDMTGQDCAKVMVMFFNSLMSKAPVDLGAYIAQHDLAKHFMLVQQEQPTEEKNT